MGKEAVRILVVDDEQGIRDLLAFELAAHGYEVLTAAGGEDALEKVKKEKVQLILSDVSMPRMDGLSLLDAVKRLDPDVEVIMSTGYGTIETAVSAMKKGAYDFVQKPFNLDEILALVEKALEKSELKALLGVYESSKAVFSELRLDELLPVMARAFIQVLKADDASIMLADPEGRLYVAAAVGLQDDARRGARLALGERVAGKVSQDGGPVLIRGPLEEDARFAGIPSLRDIRSSLVFPLALNGERIGVLNANRTAMPEPFSAAELRHATIFASQIAQAIRNAKLYCRLEEKIRQIQEMQAQLVQSEKLAAVGQLAAGVAHEINNPLTGIMGFAELMLQGGALSPEQRQDLESILHASRRCRQIVQNLLQFSRRQKRREERVDLAASLELALRFVHYDFHKARIEIVKELPAALPAVSGDPAQLEQVLLNLLTNAGQALEGKEGGRLRIRAWAEDGRVSVSVTDNGCGIPRENLGKVFDPFFTTKPVGKGTGLGLSISYGIIQQHRGAIRVESTEGAGTCFTLELPAAPVEGA